LRTIVSRLLFLAIGIFPGLFDAYAQLDTTGLQHLFVTPQHYTAYHTVQPPKIDGRLDEAIWSATPWSRLFTDIEGDRRPKPAYATRMKMIWDDSCLYLAASLAEPDVWATLKNHDDIVFHDNDFELFIDPRNTTHKYYEIEINAINTIFDLFMPKAYRNGGSAVIDWDLKGLRSAVQVQGTLNDPAKRDSGWTVEMAIPFRSLDANRRNADDRLQDLWRINFSRVEWDIDKRGGVYTRLKNSASGRIKPEHNWVWSEQGVINMHYPERWGYLQFSKNNAAGAADAFVLPYAEEQKKYLWICYYRQKNYAARNRRYATTLQDLGIRDPTVKVGNVLNTVTMEATSRQFMAYIKGDDAITWSIDNDGLVQVVR
jgi:hypothetical protein